MRVKLTTRETQLQIIVDADGEAGINFEHTGVDGHTVLRLVGKGMKLSVETDPRANVDMRQTYTPSWFCFSPR
jgi:hypothetical protein